MVLLLFQELEVINNAQAILKRAIRECETQIKYLLQYSLFAYYSPQFQFKSLFSDLKGVVAER